MALELLNITDTAKQKMLQLLSNKSKALGIRIVLKTKGCSGLSWGMEFVEEYNGFDDKIEFDNNLTVFIDKKALLFILGTTIDYVESDLESGFTFINPNEKGKCGCGESFYV